MPDFTELRRYGLKATLPRLQILALIQASDVRHLSAEDIYRGLLDSGQEAGLATVYRVLQQLHQAGLLKQARVESGRVLYELDDGRHHDHLICETCGRLQEFRDDGIEQRQREIARKHGFVLEAHAHVLHARCADAQCAHRHGAGHDALVRARGMRQG